MTAKYLLTGLISRTEHGLELLETAEMYISLDTAQILNGNIVIDDTIVVRPIKMEVLELSEYDKSYSDFIQLTITARTTLAKRIRLSEDKDMSLLMLWNRDCITRAKLLLAKIKYSKHASDTNIILDRAFTEARIAFTALMAGVK